MNSLESKDMPLRTQVKFYEPIYKQRVGEGIKVFPEKHQNCKETILAPKGDLPSVCTLFTK